MKNFVIIFFLFASVSVLAFLYIKEDDASKNQGYVAATESRDVSDTSKAERKSTAARRVVREVRVAHLENEFESSMDLKSFVDEMREQARQGNGDAARKVAQALDECAIPSIHGIEFLDGVIKNAERFPSPRREAIVAQIELLKIRCRRLVESERISPDEIDGYRAKAFQSGDVVSQAQEIVSSSSSLPEEEVRAKLRDVATSKNPEAIFTLSEAMDEENNADSRDIFGPYSRQPFDTIAWRLVACDLGYPCGENSSLVRLRCLQTQCVPGSYREQLQFYELSPFQYEVASAREEEILGLIEDGNLEILFP